MTDPKPQPPIPAGLDLRDFSFTPIFRAQLFRSTFHATATADEWKAAMVLILKSWDQIPAGSLPTNDRQLCQLAGLGHDHLEEWRAVKRMALHGWYLCTDGRLYHPLVAEGVMAAHMRRLLEQRVRRQQETQPPAGPSQQQERDESAQQPLIDPLPDISAMLNKMSKRRPPESDRP